MQTFSVQNASESPKYKCSVNDEISNDCEIDDETPESSSDVNLQGQTVNSGAGDGASAEMKPLTRSGNDEAAWGWGSEHPPTASSICL